MPTSEQWLSKCQNWKEKWNQYHQFVEDDKDGINFYTLVESINNNLIENDVILTDAGTAFYITGQTAKIKNGCRLVVPGAQADMGFALPASVGVQLADNNLNPIVITGDGSFQTNIQELATIKANNIRTKIFIINNFGYLSIRNTQGKYYNNNVYGSTLETGLWFPNLKNICQAYEIDYIKITNNQELSESIRNSIHSDKCILFDVICKFSQEIYPSVALKTLPDNKTVQCGLEDMAPFLSDEELQSELKIS
jgi:acetolactate synthase-1/2/3 large subunit